jgi:hypothetical protein
LVDGLEVDCLWPDQRVIVLRFTCRRVVDQPATVIAELAAALTPARVGRR